VKRGGQETLFHDVKCLQGFTSKEGEPRLTVSSTHYLKRKIMLTSPLLLRDVLLHLVGLLSRPPLSAFASLARKALILGSSGLEET
jgi:hypothetical protein